MEYVVGVDFGSDSVRAVIVRASDGQVAAEAAAAYPRWAQGLYCDPGIRQFRQHPQDYLEALCACVTEACAAAGETVSSRIAALSIDTTGSTPCPVNRAGTPLAGNFELTARCNFDCKMCYVHLTAEEQRMMKQIDNDLLWYDLTNLLEEPQAGDAPKLHITLDYTVRPFAAVEKEYLELFEQYQYRETGDERR